MNDINSAVPPAAGLLARMIVLARLSEGIGRFGARRILLDKIVRRTLLFSRMSGRLGIAAPESPLMRALRREAELACLECTAWRRGRRCVVGPWPSADNPQFCP